ncbi:hypothetical protein T492DRAFT_1007916 [Pavlovales sp. CCMP2436]|nr:hypothetical protein T492DRAFT_1007916 [Pavlovales sp. CCMP2436]
MVEKWLPGRTRGRRVLCLPPSRCSSYCGCFCERKTCVSTPCAFTLTPLTPGCASSSSAWRR